MAYQALLAETPLSRAALDAAIVDCLGNGTLGSYSAETQASGDESQDPGRAGMVLVHGEHLTAIEDRAVSEVAAFHKANPRKPGLSREELRTRVAAALDARIFGLALGRLVAARKVIVEDDRVRAASFKAVLDNAFQQAAAEIERRLAVARLEPPSPQDLASAMSLDQRTVSDAVSQLVSDGRAIRVKEGMFFSALAVGDLRARLVAFLERKGQITTQEFKEMAGVTRKFAIPLGEHFDAQKLTMRVGEVRKLRPRT
jgi:selenocysteine-specific elongation factor